MKYRKKPVVVDAVQWLGTQVSWDEIHAMGKIKWSPGQMGSNTFFIDTNEGPMKVSVGDWVIKESFATNDRKFYPCKPDIFEATYDVALEM
jgi:hypothetical protein